MKISVDEVKLKRQSRLGRLALTGSLVILIGGLLITLLGPQFGLLTPENTGLFLGVYTAILVAGFAISRVGMYYGNRYLSPTRPERILREKLKGLDRKFALLLFQPPWDYILIEPGGITAIVPRTQAGKTSFVNGKWKRREGVFQMWFGREEPLGNPTEDAANAVKKIDALLKEKAEGLKVPIRALIVFTNPAAELEMEPSPIAVVVADDVKDYLRGEAKLRELPSSIQRKMREALGAPEIPKAEQS